MTEMSKRVREGDRVDTSVISDLHENKGDITLIDQLLTEQHTLTAVERFSQQHENATSPIQSKHYQDLIPIRKPSTGEQYGFEVDMDKCTGCKACVVACHSLNGLKDNESWRDIGSIRGVAEGVAEQQTVTSACHHCLDPACLSGCPVGAYEKMPETGIVRHLDDQCIGCQYCSLKCPYDVPKYDTGLGIVRKCDMCHDRLAEGEAPACVQSCPNGAISIQLINIEEKKTEAIQGGSMVAGAFRSDYTLPTTNFRSKRKLTSSMESADKMDLTPAHRHSPLVWMLMLTQVAVGISLVDGMGRLLVPSHFEFLTYALTAIALILGNIGLVASLLHIGSPRGAWRVFLGLKTSWLSREIVIFGAWMPVLVLYSGLVWYPVYNAFLPSFFPKEIPPLALSACAVIAVVLGLLSVYCSVMVYVDTQRDFWTMKRTAGRFFGSMLLGGFSVLLFTEGLVKGDVTAITGIVFLVTLLFKIFVEASLLAPARNKEWSFAKKSALIQLRSLRSILTLRWSSFAAALMCGLASLFLPPVALLVLPIVLLGEWLERCIFFQAVVTLKMPGELNQPSH
ncbi:MAG: DmsC/YnfH family molybdoenzyme membrane anchor subunit [Rubritalea sp.]|uniref:DmsC/YnfH family molybdoenzyme membrane anchor subunit n=1 Tax=Rubritalea sp. TaxID=2109375 RepID=UPI0032429E75